MTNPRRKDSDLELVSIWCQKIKYWIIFEYFFPSSYLKKLESFTKGNDYIRVTNLSKLPPDVHRSALCYPLLPLFPNFDCITDCITDILDELQLEGWTFDAALLCSSRVGSDLGCVSGLVLGRVIGRECPRTFSTYFQEYPQAPFDPPFDLVRNLLNEKPVL